MSETENQIDKSETERKESSTENSTANSTPLGAEANDSGNKRALLSKNQQKKMRRWERKLEVKRRRKQQEKDAKHAKAKAEGRDLNKEREEMLRRAAIGEGKKRRLEKWEQKMIQASSSFQVSIDCSFEHHMTAREINSLAQQLRYCYALNRRSPTPCYLHATNVTGESLQHLQNVSGFGEWGGYGFKCTGVSLGEYFSSKMPSLVYLTSDSDTVLQNLERDKIYVIGGIVDRNRLRKAALNRAESLGVSTAKLPLEKYLKEMETTKVLTVNHVFDILIKFKELKDWRKAFQAVLPDRKRATYEAEEHEQS